MPKQQFIRSELWILATMGAFQRANIYNSTATEKRKRDFRNMLRRHIEELIDNQYTNGITQEKHLINIIALSDYSASFSDLLQNGRINIGVSQKLLNLYLKYLWCNDKIILPPHFPVDRVIQSNLKIACRVNWTGITTIEQYTSIIDAAEERRLEKGYASLAEMELMEFKRR